MLEGAHPVAEQLGGDVRQAVHVGVGDAVDQLVFGVHADVVAAAVVVVARVVGREVRVVRVARVVSGNRVGADVAAGAVLIAWRRCNKKAFL